MLSPDELRNELLRSRARVLEGLAHVARLAEKLELEVLDDIQGELEVTLDHLNELLELREDDDGE